MGLKKDISFYFIGNIASKAIAFILVPIYVASMSQAEYGIVGSMQVLIHAMAILLSLGTERSVYRLYHDYKEEKYRKEFLGTVSIFIYLFGAVFLGTLLLFREQVSLLYKSIPFAPYYLLAMLIAYISTFEIVPGIYLQAAQKSKQYLIVSLIKLFISSALIIYFTVYLKQEAAGMLKGMLYGHIATLPIYIGIQYKYFSFVFKKKYLIPTLKYSLPLLPSLLSAWVINLSSQVFIERNFSTSEVAIYALSLKIVALVTVVSSAIMTAYNPTFYKVANSEQEEIGKAYLYKIQNRIIITLLVCTMFLPVISKDILHYFFSSEYNGAVYIIPILVCGTVITQMTGFLNLAFYQKKKTKQIMLIMLLSAAVTIMMNAVLIPLYSTIGAAVTYLSSALLFFILEYFISKKYYFVAFNWKNIITTLVIMSSLICMGIYLPVTILTTGIKVVLGIIVVFYLYKNIKK